MTLTDQNINKLNGLVAAFLKSHNAKSYETKGIELMKPKGNGYTHLRERVCECALLSTYTAYEINQSDAAYKVFYGSGANGYHTFISKAFCTFALNS